ncbi:MAG: hypothetical protein KDA65_07140 [Planctomycetaceae bacterium]|nr:hypothetical protein [Planctomycetaceae bacterium]MCB1563582.1 hypothetical protein [Alphaproteobacteria bacterium]
MTSETPQVVTLDDLKEKGVYSSIFFQIAAHQRTSDERVRISLDCAKTIMRVEHVEDEQWAAQWRTSNGQGVLEPSFEPREHGGVQLMPDGYIVSEPSEEGLDERAARILSALNEGNGDDFSVSTGNIIRLFHHFNEVMVNDRLRAVKLDKPPTDQRGYHYDDVWYLFIPENV